MKWFFTLILLVVTVDQLTKKLAIRVLRDAAQSITIIPDFLSLTYTENKGVAFGMEFAPAGMLLLLTGLITIIVLVYVILSKINSRMSLSVSEKKLRFRVSGRGEPRGISWRKITLPARMSRY